MAEDEKKEFDITEIKVTEEYLKEKLYEIRGKQVLLDTDLAEIYGYSTKTFNQQVKNNIDKFDDDFMFELTDDEVEYLRSNFLTANINSKSRYNPHVFTEQGDMMNSFVTDDEKWLMYNAKFCSADEVYESIYKNAKRSIYVVDNYIGLRTLVHLKNSSVGVSIILFSDNVGSNKLHNIEFADFCKEYPDLKISMQKTGGICDIIK